MIIIIHQVWILKILRSGMPFGSEYACLKEKTMIHWKIEFRQLSQSRRISFMAIKTAKLERFWSSEHIWANKRTLEISYAITSPSIRLVWGFLINFSFLRILSRLSTITNKQEIELTIFFLQRSNCFRSRREDDQSYVLTCLVNYWRSCGSQKNWLMSLLS